MVLEAERTGTAGEMGGRKTAAQGFNPSKVRLLSGTAGCKPGTCPLLPPQLPGQGCALSNSLSKTWHRMSTGGRKMENGEFIQFSSTIRYKDLSLLWMGETPDAPFVHLCRHSGLGENGPLHMEVCRGKGFHFSLQKALINQSELKDQYKGAETSGRNVREWRAMLKGGEENLQLVGDELASGTQRNQPGKCQGLLCFRF